ncbi:YpoC family protein [Niallia taxi]|uniref:YpoC family protein n=1 Tax=Niallia taxi TaxID=2499688 RepID=UPI003D288936
MTNSILLDIPNELKHRSLQSKDEKIEVICAETFQAERPFMHDAAFYHGHKTMLPWQAENVKECVSAVFILWKGISSEVEEAVKSRDKKSTVVLMEKGIRLFLECLYWSNDMPVNIKDGIFSQELKIKPFNGLERLLYILSRPGGYHSYRQLDELFRELEKQFAIKMIKRK